MVEFDFGVGFEGLRESNGDMRVFMNVMIGRDDLYHLPWKCHALYLVSYDLCMLREKGAKDSEGGKSRVRGGEKNRTYPC